MSITILIWASSRNERRLYNYVGITNIGVSLNTIECNNIHVLLDVLLIVRVRVGCQGCMTTVHEVRVHSRGVYRTDSCLLHVVVIQLNTTR